VKYNNAYPDYKLTKSGVPQESVLSPSLYLIYTAYLPTTDNTVLAIDSDPALASQKLQITSRPPTRMV
jgi:hypothetical protein